MATGVMYNGVKVYNKFGINATDADPVGEGAKFAYEHGWTSVEKAIDGGAQWISQQFINSPDKQDTLHKMRWNPADPGQHQYATDVRWAYNNSANMKKLYDNIKSGHLRFDIPIYKN